jgi:hypothetical protein
MFLIPKGAMEWFDAAIASAFRLRNPMLAEVLLIVFVYAVGFLFWRAQFEFNTTTWYAVPTAEGMKFSLTGIWFVWVSLPVFQFMLIRWFFRTFIWSRYSCRLRRWRSL